MCRVPRLLENLSQRYVLFVQHVRAVVAHAVVEWEESRHDRGVRWNGERLTGDAGGKPGAIGSQLVESRSDTRTAGRITDGVSARRVDRDQQYVRMPRTTE